MVPLDSVLLELSFPFDGFCSSSGKLNLHFIFNYSFWKFVEYLIWKVSFLRRLELSGGSVSTLS